jgi:hypothetical protein
VAWAFLHLINQDVSERIARAKIPDAVSLKAAFELVNQIFALN